MLTAHRYAITGTTIIIPTLVRLMATTGLTGLREAYSLAPALGTVGVGGGAVAGGAAADAARSVAGGSVDEALTAGSADVVLTAASADGALRTVRLEASMVAAVDSTVEVAADSMAAAVDSTVEVV